MRPVVPDEEVLLPARVAAPSMTAAGLATWLFLHAGREYEAAECELQDLIDGALRRGQSDVEVPRRVATRAIELWEAAAGLAETWASRSDLPKQAAEWRSHAERLRARAESVRKLV
jgi:hypothetical protein